MQAPRDEKGNRGLGAPAGCDRTRTGRHLIAVIEMSLSSWLVAGIVPGVERQPLKKLAVDESALLKLLHRWREEAEKQDAGSSALQSPSRLVVTASGRALAQARGIEAYVFTLRVQRCPASIGAPRLTGSTPSCSKRSFLGWLQRRA